MRDRACGPDRCAGSRPRRPGARRARVLALEHARVPPGAPAGSRARKIPAAGRPPARDRAGRACGPLPASTLATCGISLMRQSEMPALRKAGTGRGCGNGPTRRRSGGPRGLGPCPRGPAAGGLSARGARCRARRAPPRAVGAAQGGPCGGEGGAESGAGRPGGAGRPRPRLLCSREAARLCAVLTVGISAARHSRERNVPSPEKGYGCRAPHKDRRLPKVQPQLDHGRRLAPGPIKPFARLCARRRAPGARRGCGRLGGPAGWGGGAARPGREAAP